MKQYFIILSAVCLLVLAGQSVSAQTCTYSGLSAAYAFKVSLRRTLPAHDTGEQHCMVTVTILPRQHGARQSCIRYKAGYLFDAVFSDCAAIRSYTTGMNRTMEVTDNDYGDFAVADFNFDGAEDFAVKYDSGGNGGPLYYYYIQVRPGTFERDAYLSHRIAFFPVTIDARRHRLTTLVHAGAMQVSKTTYQYNRQTRKWRRLSQRFVAAG